MSKFTDELKLVTALYIYNKIILRIYSEYIT